VRRISGRVIARNRASGPAPSIIAASCRSDGIDCSPVIRMIMVKPATFQTTMAMIDQKAGWKVASRLNFLSVRPSW
jgi:hypothetical protein